MKLFLRNIAFFIIFPLILLFIIEIMLPPTLFTFRIWEAVRSENDLFIGPFYPNVEHHMIEVGDLSHHTKSAVEKEVTWRTDELGFRNNKYISKPDILLIGDSNIAGSSLSQEETLASILSQCTGLSVYSLAPANINTFIELKNGDIMQVPQIVVLSGVERNLHSLPSYNDGAKIKIAPFQLNPFRQFVAVQLDKLFRINSLNYLKARKEGSVGTGIQSTMDNKMFFLLGSEAVIEPTDNELDQISEKIRSYKDYCDSIGCEFIFLPIPNKETIFWEMVELEKQPTFIGQLNHKLRSKGITTIETVKLFNRLKDNEILPYHYDDSHWNKYAVDLVAKEIARLSTSSRNGAGMCNQIEH